MKFVNFKFLGVLVALFMVTQVAAPAKSFAGGGSRPSYVASGPCPCSGSAGNGSVGSNGAGNSGRLYSSGGLFGGSNSGGGFLSSLGDLIAMPFRAVGTIGSLALNGVGSALNWVSNGIGSIFGGGSQNGSGVGSNGGASMACMNNGFNCVENGSRNVPRNVACATPGACATGTCYPGGGVVIAQPNNGNVAVAQPTGGYATPTGSVGTGGTVAYPSAPPTYGDTMPNVQPNSTCPDPAAANNGVYITPGGAASIAI